MLYARMKQGKHISDELSAFFRERSLIEEEFSNRLNKLAKTFNPKEELGTLRDALEDLKLETEKTARAHQELANDIRLKIEKPLNEFISTQTSLRKNVTRFEAN